MKSKYIRDVLFTLSTFFLLIIGINILLFPEMPGFIDLRPHPYLIVILLMAGRFGLKESLLTAFMAGLLLAFYIYLDSGTYFQWQYLLHADVLITFASFFLAAILVGELRNFNKSYERSLLQENHELKIERQQLYEQLEIITELKEELENRILGQEETVHSLYQATKALETLEEKDFFEALPKLTARFTGATKVSLYMIDYTQDCIRLVSHFGSSEPHHRNQTIPLYHDIFDLVMKNNSVLTIKEISDNREHLRLWERSPYKAYAYVPIAMSSVIVGVLTIDDIPFLRLNISTIRILSLIAELAVPALKNIISYQDLQNMVKIDPVTELFKHDSFMNLSEVEFKKATRYNFNLSLLAVEINSLMALREHYGHDTYVRGLKKIAKSISNTLRNVDICGLGPREGQILITLPHTDTDGALSVIERLKKIEHALNEKLKLRQAIRFSFGVASYHPSIPNLEKLLEATLKSLEMNKTAKIHTYEANG